MPKPLLKVLAELLTDLIQGSYETIERSGRSGPLSAYEIEMALQGYPATFIYPVKDLESIIHVFPVKGSAGTYIIDMPLWSVEEGQSDLTVRVTATVQDGTVAIHINDIDVM